MEIKSPYEDVVFPKDMSYPQAMVSRLKEHGSVTALIKSRTGEKVSYGELRSQIIFLSHELVSRGVKKGDVFMICSGNNLLYPVVLFAAAAAGAIVTTAGHHLTPDELHYMIQDSSCRYIAASVTVVDTIRTALTKISTPIQQLLTFEDHPEFESLSQLMRNGSRRYPDKDTLPQVDFTPEEDVLFLPYSSGTTGLPKGVMTTHCNVLCNIYQINNHPISGLTPSKKDIVICPMPFYHSFGMCTILGLCIFRGDTIVVMEQYNIKDYLDAVVKYKVSILHLVPPIAVHLAKHPAVEDYDLSIVHTLYCGAAPLSKETEVTAMQRTGVNVFRQGYGMTELSPVSHVAPFKKWKHGSCGVPIPNTRCQVVDGEGRMLGPMCDGELLIKGPQVMKGYWRRPEATSQTIDADGWLHTGDISHYDEQGYFYVVDRLKELIKWKAFQVAPAELESVLLEHPSVADVAVIGIADEEAGELPKAFIVLKPGTHTSSAEIIEYVAGKVSPHKRLRGGVEFLEVIPKSASGKILRKKLKKSGHIESSSKL